MFNRQLKKLLILILVTITGIFAQSFAYTPSSQLVTQLDQVVIVIEQGVEARGEGYRTYILGVFDQFLQTYAGNDRAEYILTYLSDEIAASAQDTTSVVLPTSSYLTDYTIDDTIYGTLTTVTILNNVRTIDTNTLPNHETGEFPRPGNPNTISAQSVTHSFPAVGTYVGGAERAQTTGVGINGVKMEPETNENFTCDSGETYKIEAFQDYADLGLDMQNAHVQPTGEYHYHGRPDGLSSQMAGNDIVHVGFAPDGFLIYYSKLGTFAPSFQLVETARTGTSCTYRGDSRELSGTYPDGTFVSDREYVDGLGDLDECNGIEINGEYVYFMTNDYPYIGRCLNGEVAQGGGGGGGAGGPPSGGGAGGPPTGGAPAA